MMIKGNRTPEQTFAVFYLHSTSDDLLLGMPVQDCDEALRQIQQGISKLRRELKEGRGNNE